jgi:hypothetical protein
MSVIPENLKSVARNFTLQLHTVKGCPMCKIATLPANLEKTRKQITPIKLDIPIQHNGWDEINLIRQFPAFQRIEIAPSFVLLPSEDVDRNATWERASIFRSQFRNGVIEDFRLDPQFPEWQKNESFEKWLIRSLREFSEQNEISGYSEASETDFIAAPKPKNKNPSRKVHANFILINDGQISI